MASDVKKLVALAELAGKPIPEIGLPPLSYPQLWRIARNGTRARDGRVIRLKVVRIGGKLYTSLADIRTYLDELNAADDRHFARTEKTSTPQPRPRLKRHRPSSTNSRRAAIRRAEQEAKAAGI